MRQANQPTAEQLLVDEYCDLREAMKAWKPNVNPHAARFAEVSEKLLALYEQSPGSGPLVAEGVRYVLPVSARRMQRSVVNLVGFFKRIGRDRYLALCPPTLAAIEKEIPPERRMLYISEAQTGKRTLLEPSLKDAGGRAAAA